MTWSAKLTEPDVVAIRSAYAAGGVSQCELAERYGVTQRSINHIVCGKTWRRVPSRDQAALLAALEFYGDQGVQMGELIKHVGVTAPATVRELRLRRLVETRRLDGQLMVRRKHQPTSKTMKGKGKP